MPVSSNYFCASAQLLCWVVCLQHWLSRLHWPQTQVFTIQVNQWRENSRLTTKVSNPDFNDKSFQLKLGSPDEWKWNVWYCHLYQDYRGSDSAKLGLTPHGRLWKEWLGTHSYWLTELIHNWSFWKGIYMYEATELAPNWRVIGKSDINWAFSKLQVARYRSRPKR